MQLHMALILGNAYLRRFAETGNDSPFLAVGMTRKGVMDGKSTQPARGDARPASVVALSGFQQFFSGLSKALHGRIRDFAAVFTDSEIVQLKMFEFRNACQPQAVRSTRQRATIDHQEFRRFLDCIDDGLNATANASEATHFSEAEIVEASGRVVGQFAGVGTAGAGEDTGQGSGFVGGRIGGVHRVKLCERRS
jgi:hypothetical protein